MTALHGSQPRCPRSLAAQQRLETQAQTEREIDELVAHFHARLPREQAKDLGAIYARYSSKFQHSILDQVRSLFEAALAMGIFIPREYVCFDLAVRGCKSNRPGLNRLRAILEKKAVQVLLVFSTNRLFRKMYKALQFVEEEVVERGIRGVFLASHIDTADRGRWQTILQVNTITDEAGTRMYADHVRSAHMGLLAGRSVHGTVTFGYRGHTVEGRPTKRGRPRQDYEVDPETSTWVQRAFEWFVVNSLSISEIVRRFNGSQAPLSSKAINGRWTYQAIRRLLANPRYRGQWAYGTTENVWQSKKDYSRQVRRAEPLQEYQFEDLRIVSDSLWHQAQARLARVDRSNVGRRPEDGGRRKRPHLLNGLLFCAEHDHRLYAGGSHGTQMFCKVCRETPKLDRPLYSQLNRELAVEQTCKTLQLLIQQDEVLVEQVREAIRRETAAYQAPDPCKLKSLRARLETLTTQIRFVMENVGVTETDRQESEVKLRQLRQERAEVQGEISILTEAGSHPIAMPDEADIRSLIERIGAILTKAGQGEDKEDLTEARQVVEFLTGGRIELVQQGERKAQQGWLQGRFRPRLVATVVAMLKNAKPDQDADSPYVTIDYCEPTPSEALSDRVKELYDAGKMIKVIALELGITRYLASRALDHWYQHRGLRKPDGRTRRASLAQWNLKDPLFLRIVDQAMQLYSEGLLIQEIATQLQCDRNTVSKAIKYGHKVRGLPLMDGRSRRKHLRQPHSRPCETDIEHSVSLSPVVS